MTVENGKSPFLMGKSTISMAIFNSYVQLPEGKPPTSTQVAVTLMLVKNDHRRGVPTWVTR
jgi:hypothetical protein